MKWLAEQHGEDGPDSANPYAELKRRVNFGTRNECLTVELKQRVTFHPVSHNNRDADPMQLDPACIARMAAMMRDQSRPIEVRKRFAAILVRELAARKNDPALSGEAFCVEQVSMEAASILDSCAASAQPVY